MFQIMGGCQKIQNQTILPVSDWVNLNIMPDLTGLVNCHWSVFSAGKYTGGEIAHVPLSWSSDDISNYNILSQSFNCLNIGCTSTKNRKKGNRFSFAIGSNVDSPAFSFEGSNWFPTNKSHTLLTCTNWQKVYSALGLMCITSTLITFYMYTIVFLMA